MRLKTVTTICSAVLLILGILIFLNTPIPSPEVAGVGLFSPIVVQLSLLSLFSIITVFVLFLLIREVAVRLEALEMDKKKPMQTCIGCGMQIPIDYNACPHCGKKVEKS